MEPGRRKLEENPPFFDDEEREDIESLDIALADSFSPEDVAAQRAEAQRLARETLAGLRQFETIEMSSATVRQLSRIASGQGITVEALLDSIVHQYVEGRLKEL